VEYIEPKKHLTAEDAEENQEIPVKTGFSEIDKHISIPGLFLPLQTLRLCAGNCLFGDSPEPELLGGCA